jgi:hypothetical protein
MKNKVLIFTGFGRNSISPSIRDHGSMPGLSFFDCLKLLLWKFIYCNPRKWSIGKVVYMLEIDTIYCLAHATCGETK